MLHGAGPEQVGLLTDGNDDEKNEEGVGDRDDRGRKGEDDLENSRAQNGSSDLTLPHTAGIHAKIN